MSTGFDPNAGTPALFGGGTMMGATASIKQGDTVFSRYTLRKVLGVGGMGVVWLAHDTKLDQEVALKFVPEALQHDPDAINDLKVQTKLGLKLTHNNIVRVLGFEDDGDRLAAIAMEYVDGATLAAMRVDQPAQVFEADSLHVYLLHILDALEYAHEQEKIVHRDLKPANVMVNSEDRVKVADFGIACSLRNSVGRVMSLPQRAGSGTLSYMSPQQLLGAPASVADDIYSLGATTFELMTGTPPFHTGDVNMQIREIPAPAMMQRRVENAIQGEEIPAAWEEVIAASLAKEPSQRPSNVAEFRKGLLGQPFKRGAGTGAAAAAVPVPPVRAPLPTVMPAAAPPANTKAPLSMMVLTSSLVSVAIVGAGLYFLSASSKSDLPPKPTEEERIAALAKSYTEEESRLLAYEKTEAPASAKFEKWDRLMADVREIQGFQSNQSLRDIVRNAQDRKDHWKQKDDTERQQYQRAVLSLGSAVESARRDCENKELGAAAKAALWNDIILKNSSALAGITHVGGDHEALLEEARGEAAAWRTKAAAETPAVAPAEDSIFAMSHAAGWGAAGKKKLLQAVQTALAQRGHPPGVVDGTWGASTFYALVAWQQAEKLPATGVLDQPSLMRLSLHAMQEPAPPPVTVVQGPAPARPASSGNSSTSPKPAAGGTSWEDVAKMKVLQGGPGGGAPMRPPLPFR